MAHFLCAIYCAAQDTWNWPLIDPLPSYGRGRERPGGRYMSFIHGDGLRDVIITGSSSFSLLVFCWITQAYHLNFRLFIHACLQSLF